MLRTPPAADHGSALQSAESPTKPVWSKWMKKKELRQKVGVEDFRTIEAMATRGEIEIKTRNTQYARIRLDNLKDRELAAKFEAAD